MSLEIPMTKLEAVNALLEDLGDRPVNTLTGVTRLDVARAERTLDKISRDVQEKGWWFNTQRVRLVPNGSDQYVIPDEYVHVEWEKDGPTTGQYNETPNLVVRNGVLFDTANNTDVFTGAGQIQLIVHVLLPYESLPSTAKSYVYASASVRNQSRALGSRNVDNELREQARVAYAQLLQEDVDNENINLTTAPRFVTMMWDA